MGNHPWQVKWFLRVGMATGRFSGTITDDSIAASLGGAGHPHLVTMREPQPLLAPIPNQLGYGYSDTRTLIWISSFYFCSDAEACSRLVSHMMHSSMNYLNSKNFKCNLSLVYIDFQYQSKRKIHCRLGPLLRSFKHFRTFTNSTVPNISFQNDNTLSTLLNDFCHYIL